ncbi:DUF4129 domain-containing protein [Salinimicrobium oceani]|uniref:DUF4129 domain-containing protein n=1 Tax=Salinimicrobium oceani TaxID=2722702 RepID=A0ABX1CX09_9FLAO|nr:DUF4129 domain-containing protein [Salinimicrobium oceani]NJW52821.1 DUF4129 domain-containing protein [Salinimicrobium oceani]
MAKLFLIFFLGFSFFGISSEAFAVAQTAETDLKPLEFSEKTLKRFKEDPAFNYTEVTAEDNWWTKFKRYVRLHWQRFLDWMFGDYEAPLLLAIFLDILPYLLLGLLLALILYLFTKINPGNHFFGTPAEVEVHFEEEEKIIRNRNIKKLIENALAKENYRLAVRYHFLYALQQLSRQEIVIYDSSKTDEEYVKEIQLPALQAQFKKVNRIYDFVWYGNFAPTSENYQKIRKEFEKAELLIQPRYEQSL